MGIDAWRPEGGLVASPAWGNHLAPASALGLILHPGDSRGVYPRGKPRHCLVSLHQHRQKVGLGQFCLPLPVHITCGISQAVIPGPDEQDQNMKVGEGGLE